MTTMMYVCASFVILCLFSLAELHARKNTPQEFTAHIA